VSERRTEKKNEPRKRRERISMPGRPGLVKKRTRPKGKKKKKGGTRPEKGGGGGPFSDIVHEMGPMMLKTGKGGNTTNPIAGGSFPKGTASVEKKKKFWGEKKKKFPETKKRGGGGRGKKDFSSDPTPQRQIDATQSTKRPHKGVKTNNMGRFPCRRLDRTVPKRGLPRKLRRSTLRFACQNTMGGKKG